MDKVEKVFTLIYNNNRLKEELIKKQTIDEMYEYCTSISGGYTKEEFRKFIDEMYQYVKEELINKNLSISDEDIKKVSGGLQLNNKAISSLLAAITVSTPFVGAAGADNDQKNDNVPVENKTSIAQKIKDFVFKHPIASATGVASIPITVILGIMLKSQHKEKERPKQEPPKQEPPKQEPPEQEPKKRDEVVSDEVVSEEESPVLVEEREHFHKIRQEIFTKNSELLKLVKDFDTKSDSAWKSLETIKEKYRTLCELLRTSKENNRTYRKGIQERSDVPEGQKNDLFLALRSLEIDIDLIYKQVRALNGDIQQKEQECRERECQKQKTSAETIISAVENITAEIGEGYHNLEQIVSNLLHNNRIPTEEEIAGAEQALLRLSNKLDAAKCTIEQQQPIIQSINIPDIKQRVDNALTGARLSFEQMELKRNRRAEEIAEKKREFEEHQNLVRNRFRI